MVYWGIVELQNGIFNSVTAPYNSQLEAYDHLDKIKAYRAKNPGPIKFKWLVVKIYRPDYIGGTNYAG